MNLMNSIEVKHHQSNEQLKTLNERRAREMHQSQ